MKGFMEHRILIDTSIIIDGLCKYAPAIEFIEKHEIVNISFVSEVELMIGCGSKNNLKTLSALLATYNVEYCTLEISQLASELVCDYYLSDGIGLGDSLIAATCLLKNYCLATRDLTHFKNIKGLRIEEPY